MKNRSSIRGRMVAAFVLLAAIIGGVFAGSAFFVIEEIESQLIDKRLVRVTELWTEGLNSTAQLQASDLSFFVGQQLPQSLRSLNSGIHELRLNGRTLHVLIGESDGQRYAVVDDQSDFEAIEDRTYIALSLAFLGGLALALLVGRASASRVILPLTELASAVQDEQREERLPGLDATDELGVLARAIEDRTNQLNQALQRERWFTADVSHELRSPLTILLGAAEALRRRLKDHPKLQAMTECIRQNAADIAQQMGALLELARVPESSHLFRIALRPLIEQELQRCQPLLLGKPVEIEFIATDDVLVPAIPELVSIAVSHLLRNACLHTERGVITIHLSAGGIAIEDNGTGVVDAPNRGPFKRPTSAHGETSSGPGLNLSIVKRVADHLGWAVRHTSATSGGNRYVLEFDIRHSQALQMAFAG
ncbi:sensor histidine kinase [Metapseudomonas resinovorans]|uniref:sensor histidine kinase n=1 Tax=Metapseudomonas resinovorans TaxID=53412 RepID=UPI000410379F|nr:HAMP domain-containing sensor histidine kinase [Pseudomonas resinovorans]MDE3738817.1 HAMP domain-containing sensor histidine kinase [Pseudomonas resinovorans]